MGSIIKKGKAMIERFESFSSAIATATKCIIKLKAREVRAKGLRATHVMTLLSIGRGGTKGVTAQTIGKYCREDKAGISKTLTTLKEKGYVVADRESDKKYRARYFLTAEGETLYTKIREDIRVIVSRCGEGVSDEERDVFYRVFDTIVKNLLAVCDEADAEDAKKI